MAKPKKTRKRFKPEPHPDNPVPLKDWTIPTPDWPLLDEARLGYWRAVLTGQEKRIASALKAWSDLLRVPRKT